MVELVVQVRGSQRNDDREVGLVAGTLRLATGLRFIRVDLLSNLVSSDAYFGELTPYPVTGNNKFSEEWDKKLGQLWCSQSRHH